MAYDGTDYSSPADMQQMLIASGLGGTRPLQQVNGMGPLPGVPGGAQPQGAYNAQQGAGTFNPATVQSMLALHGQRNEMGNIERSRKLADQLRSDASGLMKPKQAGRVVVGPRWWDAAAKLGADWQAGRMEGAADEKAAGLDKTFGKTMQDIIDEYNAKAATNRGM